MNTPAARPYSLSLAIATASSSVEKRSTHWTGPNTSSRAIRMPLSTPTQDGRLDEVPVRQRRVLRRPAAARDGRAALGGRALQQPEHAVALRARGERPEVAVLERRARR